MDTKILSSLASILQTSAASVTVYHITCSGLHVCLNVSNRCFAEKLSNKSLGNYPMINIDADHSPVHTVTDTVALSDYLTSRAMIAARTQSEREAKAYCVEWFV